ncbi:MAG: high light inducible protein [Candidatus Synechococcus spongiarum SP3]|uniref:High light inducible protein n=1 Tax=Candidatus Synechococcus spongiarum SP3 TaxID=1604020 RepID=A0A0G2HMC6_9SYNE|nr:MAG: high light inducible protein [Candidatus Synechococcus spongiarum SP3]
MGRPVAEPVSREELNRWKRGFTPQAEIWNGRLAMIGLSVAILVIVLLRLA